MHEQPTASMLQDIAIRATGEEKDTLPEPIHASMHADWAIDREPATLEETSAFMAKWDPTAMNLTRD
eukprot:5109980-Pyramimonas_sp.AAC.1